MPSFTFSSTANAVLLRGAKPVFAEINAKTLNLNPEAVYNCITDKTKAIVPVHYAGIGCEMDQIMDMANKYKLYIIEDAAQAVNAKLGGKYLGGIGHMGCYSFHGTKNFTSGEGGALAINTQDEQLIDRADCIRQKGTDRSKFLRGEVASYSWVDVGSSYSPSDLLMAMLYSQLQDMDYITKRRKRVHEFYSNLLQKYVDKEIIKVTQIPTRCESNYHIFYILFNDSRNRDYVMEKLHQKGISAFTHFEPLHSALMGRSLGYRADDLPITLKVSQSILRLPIYPELTEVEMDFIAECLEDILEGL
jgi:dTDP-4-amino-4,6-dideoxygalactose transaminase